MLKQKMRLTALVLLLGCVPMLLFAVFSYMSIARPLADKHAAYQRQILLQNQNAIERLLWDVSITTDAFIQSESRQEAMLLDMSGHDFQAYRQTTRELMRLQPYDSMQSDACLISLKRGWIINNSGLYRLSATEHADKYQAFINATDSPLWVTYLPPSNESSQKIYDTFFSGAAVNLVKTLPIGARQNLTGLMLVKLPLAYLSQQLSAQDGMLDILILDESLRVIADASQTQLGEPFAHQNAIRQMLANGESTGTFSIQSDKHGTVDMLVQHSSYNGWYYVLSAPHSQMVAEYSSIGVTIFLICVGCLLILFFCSFFVSRTTYKPIVTLVEELSQEDDALPGKDAFSYIAQRIGRMRENQVQLEQEVFSQMHAIREYTTVSILLGDLDEPMLSKQMRLFDGAHAGWNKAVLVMQPSQEEGSERTQSAGMLITSILQEIAEKFSREYILCPVIISQSLVMVLSGSEDSEADFRQHIMAVAGKLQELLGAYTSASFSIGVSKYFTRLEDACHAYIEAVNVLKYRIQAGNKTLLFCEDMIPTHSIHPQMYQKNQNKLLSAIRMADAEKAAQHLDALFNDVLQNGLSHNEFVAPLLGLLTELIVLSEEIGAPLQEHSGERSLYDRLLAHHTRDDMRRWLWEVMIKPCIAKVRQSHDSQYHHIAKTVRDMIESQFDKDITIESCAEALNYHPAHIRRVFLEITGENFGEYLNRCRMEAAKQWLHTTDMMVQDIAVRLGYSNSQNFIRNFRAYTGSTPGAYRKIHQNPDDTTVLPRFEAPGKGKKP